MSQREARAEFTEEIEREIQTGHLGDSERIRACVSSLGSGFLLTVLCGARVLSGVQELIRSRTGSRCPSYWTYFLDPGGLVIQRSSASGLE